MSGTQDGHRTSRAQHPPGRIHGPTHLRGTAHRVALGVTCLAVLAFGALVVPSAAWAATVAISNQAATGAPVGSPIYDTATLSTGINPTGTITFRLYEPADPTCAGTPVFTTSTAVSGGGFYMSSKYVPSVSGHLPLDRLLQRRRQRRPCRIRLFGGRRHRRRVQAAADPHRFGGRLGRRGNDDRHRQPQGRNAYGHPDVQAVRAGQRHLLRHPGLHVHQDSGGERRIHLGSVHRDCRRGVPVGDDLRRRHQQRCRHRPTATTQPAP